MIAVDIEQSARIDAQTLRDRAPMRERKVTALRKAIDKRDHSAIRKIMADLCKREMTREERFTIAPLFVDVVALQESRSQGRQPDLSIRPTVVNPPSPEKGRKVSQGKKEDSDGENSL
jgi:hypothetical protein